jgi:hypothetical protein
MTRGHSAASIEIALQTRIEKLERELEVAKSFHAVAVVERNLERVKNARLEVKINQMTRFDCCAELERLKRKERERGS